MNEVSKGRLYNKIALVKNASKGIGKGIAQVLIEEGAIVYITGRKVSSNNSENGDVLKTAEELNKLNKGKCVPIYLDHSKESEIQNVFDKIEKENNSLDILINTYSNEFDMCNKLYSHNFWEQDYSAAWKKIIDSNLKSSYIFCCMAIKIMMKKKSGLIVNVSICDKMISSLNPLLSAAKDGIDRFTVEMDDILKEYNINTISLWPGIIISDSTNICEKDKNNNNYNLFSESIYLTGRAIRELYLDKNLKKKSGKIHLVADLANEYKITDIDGSHPSSVLSLKYIVGIKLPYISNYIPHFIKIPKFILAYYYSKF